MEKKNLSKHFCQADFEKSVVADRLGFVNLAPASAVDNLRLICTNILEPILLHFNAKIYIVSGFRCPELNSFLGGAIRSPHLTGNAVDFYCQCTSPMYAIFAWARTFLDYDQLIFVTNSTTQHVHIHVSINPNGNRHIAFIKNLR